LQSGRVILSREASQCQYQRKKKDLASDMCRVRILSSVDF